MGKLNQSNLSADDVSTITNALRVAATRFDESAKVCGEAGHPRLVEQFTRQALDSRAVADRIEDAAGVILEGV
jgi:hypothetical protein